MRRASQSGAGVASEFSTQTQGAPVALTPRLAPPAKPWLCPGSSPRTPGWGARGRGRAGGGVARQRGGAVRRAVVGDDDLGGRAGLGGERGETLGEQVL